MKEEKKKEKAKGLGYYMTGNFGIYRPFFQRMARKIGVYRDYNVGK